MYSQGGQDGIIEYIFDHIGTANTPPFAVEFGFNTVTLDGGSGSNVANLVLNKGWRALLLDGRHANPDINLHRQFLTSDNIADVFAAHAVPQEPDYVSIDVDSSDLWLMEAVLQSYAPRLLSVEYNVNFPIHRAITMMNTGDVRFDGTRAYGASLKALTMVAEANGYALVAVERKLDAFFVRKDLLADTDVPDLADFRRLCDRPLHSPCAEGSQAMRHLIDYEVYLSNGQDAEAATVWDDDEIRHICQTRQKTARRRPPSA